MSIYIICDSGCDIVMTKEEQEKEKLTILPLKTRFGENEYLDGVDITHKEFFEKLIETDEFPQTSQVSPFEYEQAYKKVKEAGGEAVVISVSAKLSGCHQSATMARDGYEDIVYLVDSENATIGQHLLISLAMRYREEGMSAAQIVEKLNEEKKNIRLVALLDTLEYLKKGGRISAATAMIGGMLSIKPVVTVQEGEVKVLGKARGSKNGNNLLTELIEKEGGINFDKPYCLAYSGLTDVLLRKYMKDHEHIYIGHCSDEEMPIYTIGSAIGTHVGPGAIAAAFFTV